MGRAASLREHEQARAFRPELARNGAGLYRDRLGPQIRQVVRGCHDGRLPALQRRHRADAVHAPEEVRVGEVILQILQVADIRRRLSVVDEDRHRVARAHEPSQPGQSVGVLNDDAPSIAQCRKPEGGLDRLETDEVPAGKPV